MRGVSSPQDLAFIPNPLTLLVADENNHRVQEWSVDPNGDALVVSYRRSFGAYGSGQGQIQNPRGVAVDKGQVGDMYVADTYNHRVQLWRRDTVGPRTYAYSKVTVRRGAHGAPHLQDQRQSERRVHRRDPHLPQRGEEEDAQPGLARSGLVAHSHVHLHAGSRELHVEGLSQGPRRQRAAQLDRRQDAGGQPLKARSRRASRQPRHAPPRTIAPA